MSKKQTVPEQFRAMIDFMVEHPDIGRGCTDLRPEEQNDLWDKLCKKLNSMGPPIRDVASWKKVWRDYKANTKKKLVINKQQIEGTGGGPNKLIPLSDMEEAVSTLLNFKMSVGGISNVSSFGVANAVPLDAVISSPQATEEDYQPKSKYFRKEPKEKNNSTLLQEQIEAQKQFYEDYKTLKKEELGHLEAIAKHLKAIADKTSNIKE